MRLYRFLGQDIDVTLVTDGSNDQKRIFITESPRGVVSPGQVMVKDEEDLGAALLEMGFNWKAGQLTTHEELVAFANSKGLELIITPEGLNNLESAKAVWNGDVFSIVLNTTIPQKKMMTIQFVTASVTLADSVSRYGEVSADKKSVTGKMWKNIDFTLADLGLTQKASIEANVINNVKVINVKATVAD